MTRIDSDVNDLPTWYLAQLDKDEQDARSAQGIQVTMHFDRDQDAALQFMTNWRPGMVLADIAAKRQIVKLHPPAKFTDLSLGIQDLDVCLRCHVVLDEPDNRPDTKEWGYPFVQEVYPCATLRVSASAYDERPGYQPAWAPTKPA